MDYSPKEIVKAIVSVLDNRKAEEIDVINIMDLTIIADYFIIATGNNRTHVKALADEVEFKLSHEMGIKPRNTEGYSTASWILEDYSSVVVHIFSKETREFYKLERLWSDGIKIEISEFIGEQQKSEV